jgi:hypothetical protein
MHCKYTQKFQFFRKDIIFFVYLHKNLNYENYIFLHSISTISHINSMLNRQFPLLLQR